MIDDLEFALRRLCKSYSGVMDAPSVRGVK
jgi:hypothetical protein